MPVGSAMQQPAARKALPPARPLRAAPRGSPGDTTRAPAGSCFLPVRRSQGGRSNKGRAEASPVAGGFPEPRPRGSKGARRPFHQLHDQATPLTLATVQGISVSGNTASGKDITIKQKGKKLFLVCKGENNKTHWLKDSMNLTYQGEELVLAVMDDPRGIYQCVNSKNEDRRLQVFIRMCQNCIRLDLATILGISAASLITTIFLAIAVYHIAVEERGRPAQASDKQGLLANDQLYQPLQERNDRPYSHVGIAKPRRR